MADEKVECPDCDGYGLLWDGDEFEDHDCRTCNGEGEVDEASL